MEHCPAGTYLVALCLLTLPKAGAQTDTVDVPSDIPPSIGHLNAAIDTAIASGTLSSTVFRLEPAGYYVLTGTITVPAGEHLTIVAPEPGRTQDSAPPQLVWSDTVDAGNTKFSFRCYGDITLKNLWLLYARTNGQQMRVSLQIEDSPDSVEGQDAVFEGITFDYSACPWNASGAVGVTAKHFKGTFANCYFRNCVDEHLGYYGRAISFPYHSLGWHSDSVIFENCTFANIGYVYQQEDGNYADYVKFNHCTFLNVVMFSLESGWWKDLALTNCIFVNPHMIGHIPAMHAEEDPNGGAIRIDSVSQFGFAVPFTENDRHVLFANSSYFVEDWLRDWMKDNPESNSRCASGRCDEVPVPQPMLNGRTLRFFDASNANGEKSFPFMNRATLYDSADPQFRAPPSDTARIKTFLYYKWFTSADTNWAYAPQLSLQRVWPLTDDLSYSNPILMSAGMGTFPLGDLYHWWPEDYTRWKAQEDEENARISQWLETGVDPVIVSVEALHGSETPVSYLFEQNYPNPFNPTTQIAYQLPVASSVRLSVFDLLGREVRALVNERQAPGSYEVQFDASGLASGVYIYRLTAESFVQSRKMLLVR